ncbi:ankyrin repeat containing protein [Penicillium cataractarum]|uniref:Ankyrin repeat containing protein n=1 Tax=Penicillium cataractarum TaxID=2100454 RepID=A0A9W9SMQ9_9EURO|nr:ankyrin repeat containing protein [Penicillium cataractarum]KAJ5381152.1 ankyrin repeat containing protein [Penicillium cataractarum]
MDPLSIIASSVAIATLAAQTCRAFAALRSKAKGLPGRMHALNNEVADLELVLNEVAAVFKERDSTLLIESETANIPRLLELARGKLLELKLILERLGRSMEGSNSKLSPFINLLDLRKEQPRLGELQEELKSVRCNLNVMLGASNSRDMVRVRVELEGLSMVTSQIADQTNIRKELQDSLTYHHGTLADTVERRVGQLMEKRITQVEEMMRAQSEALKQNQITQTGALYRRPRPRRPSSQHSQSPIAPESVRVRVNQYTFKCQSGCTCACHKQTKTNASFMNRVLGQIFVGYAGLPMVSPKCDSSECEKSQTPFISFEYWFPLGFCWSKIVQAQVSYHPSFGPQFNITTLRSVPDTAPCVEFALHGNIEGLKGLFNRGAASPWDVSATRGYTLVRWALYGKQYKTVKFLVQQGADADYRPLSPYDNSPRNKASDIALQGGLAKEDLEALYCLTQGSDWIEEQNFNLIHKIVCGLSQKSLEKQIIAEPESIDCQDALGRTPLLWAAARGDAASVAILLAHGANPDMLDHQLAPPVSYAADRNHTVCVRLLLEAGAETDPILPNGYIGGSALNCAARNASDPLILKTLLDFGADIEAAGVDGRTSLIHAARTDNASFAMLLLEYGADINATSSSNQTPLTTAVINNSHNVLRLLLERWAEYSECPRLKGPHLLQIAALYADIETLHILTQTDHFRMKHDKNFSVGDFVERLKQRYDVSEKLIQSFEDFLTVINTEPKYTQDEQDLMEKGFMSWHSSRVGSHCGSELANCSPPYYDFDEIDSPDSDTFEDALEKLDISERLIEVE